MGPVKDGGCEFLKKTSTGGLDQRLLGCLRCLYDWCEVVDGVQTTDCTGLDCDQIAMICECESMYYIMCSDGEFLKDKNAALSLYANDSELTAQCTLVHDRYLLAQAANGGTTPACDCFP